MSGHATPAPVEAGWPDAMGTVHPAAGARARVVSLVPSLTELLVDLGLGRRLVGRTGFCIHPRPAVDAIPKVGGTKDVDVEAVRRLAPTHVVVNVDENRRETVEAIAAFVPNVVVTHPRTVADNVGLYRLLGGVFGADAEARTLESRLVQALSGAREAVAGAAARPRVLYLIWREPWMTVGPDTYVADALRLAGLDPVSPPAQARYPVVDPVRFGPSHWDAVLLSSEPYRFLERHRAALEADRTFGSVPVLLVDGEMTSWYGSRAIAGVRAMARLGADVRARLAGAGALR